MKSEWTKEFGAAITLCDPEGTILEINDRATQIFEAEGGRQLIGKNVLDCHPEPARSRLAQMLQEQRTNVYITERQGEYHFVYQSPWFENGQFAGFCRDRHGCSAKHSTCCERLKANCATIKQIRPEVETS